MSIDKIIEDYSKKIECEICTKKEDAKISIPGKIYKEADLPWYIKTLPLWTELFHVKREEEDEDCVTEFSIIYPGDYVYKFTLVDEKEAKKIGGVRLGAIDRMNRQRLIFKIIKIDGNF